VHESSKLISSLVQPFLPTHSNITHMKSQYFGSFTCSWVKFKLITFVTDRVCVIKLHRIAYCFMHYKYMMMVIMSMKVVGGGVMTKFSDKPRPQLSNERSHRKGTNKRINH